MAASGVRITVDSRRFKKKAKLFTRKVNDMTEAWQEIGEEMLFSINKTFAAEGRPDKWTPLAPSTVKRKKKNKNKILIESGLLKKSINWQAFSKSVTVGTSNIDYAAMQQFGGELKGPRGGTVIPPRPFIVVQDEDLKTIEQIFDEYIEKAWGK